jgi:hypothetical protein
MATPTAAVNQSNVGAEGSVPGELIPGCLYLELPSRAFDWSGRATAGGDWTGRSTAGADWSGRDTSAAAFTWTGQS